VYGTSVDDVRYFTCGVDIGLIESHWVKKDCPYCRIDSLAEEVERLTLERDNANKGWSDLSDVTEIALGEVERLKEEIAERTYCHDNEAVEKKV
jgi:hypothetical protein